jgi:predicted ATP-dependent endonuclease of OLD family
MKLIKAEIKNFRLLHDVSITFDGNATSIVGKNNSGKTSLITIFSIFLTESRKSFSFEDFSLASYHNFIEAYKCYETITEENKEEKITEAQRIIPKIQLILTIKYGEHDNWSNIQPLFTNLEESDEIKILFEYAPDSTEVFLKNLQESMRESPHSKEELIKKVNSNYKNSYKIFIRPYSESEETENISRADVNRLIQTKFISAQRILDDSDSESRSRLSKIFKDLFENENENENDEKTSAEFLQALEDASDSIDVKLKEFFSPFITHFNRFGFPGIGNEKIELKSQLEPEILFMNNIKLFYNHGGTSLPEKYNGLGYSNLICIIAHIIGFYNEIKDRKNNLNLIFIEEPEVHMHPQMQSVFVKNITIFLREVQLDTQIILTTHSSHIISSSNFESIRYFKPIPNSEIAIVKDLMDFNEKLTENETKNFLKQYLTLGKCDLFFADKAIFFEGTVERILLPIFIKKIENEGEGLNLSAQYISSIEVGGAYINKFKELIEFLGIKTLIITDIDSVKPDLNKAEVEKDKNLVTSNATLKDWIPGERSIDKLLLKEIKKESDDGLISVAYQSTIVLDKEEIKCGRSFEEEFIIENPKYIFDNKEKLFSIKNILKEYKNGDELKMNSFEIQEYIDRNKKKTDFAFDLVSICMDGWVVPIYIKEGLKWLAT